MKPLIFCAASCPFTQAFSAGRKAFANGNPQARNLPRDRCPQRRNHRLWPPVCSFSVLHNECSIRLYAKELCRQKEHLRVWLGVGDLCFVGNCIEKAAKPNALQNQRSILAGRTHGQFMTVRAQLQQCAAHIFVQIGWCHRLQIAAINRILLLCECLLLLRGVSVFLLTQDDVAIRNYIVLTQLVPDLQKMVDEKKIIFSPAYQIAALTHKKQGFLLEGIDSE